MEEGWESYHDLAHAFGKFVALLLDIGEEGVGSPAAYEHHGVGWDSLEVELHGECGSVGVSAYIFGSESKCVSAELGDGVLDILMDFLAAYRFEGVLLGVEISVDWPIRVEVGVRLDPPDRVSPEGYGVEEFVIVSVHDDLVVVRP